MSILFILSLFFIVIGKTMQNLLNKKISIRSSIIETSLYIRFIPVLLIIPVLYLNQSFYILNYKFIILSIFVGFLLGISTLILAKSYQIGEISVITPFYSLNPIFGGIFSWIILSQELSEIGILGVLMISLGGYIIKIEKFNSFIDPVKRIYKDKGVLYLVTYSIIIGFISPFDSTGVNNVSPELWLFYTYLFSSILIFIYYIYKNNLSYPVNTYNYKDYLLFVSIGFFTFISVFSLFYAYQFLEVAYVLSIFMLNIVLTSLIGMFIYNESVRLNKIISIFMMSIGAIIILIS